MIEITESPLVPEKVTGQVRRDTNGAVVTFLGTTRRFTAGHEVLYLEYEAYSEMAYKKLHQIVEEVKQRWNIQDIALCHRVGRVDVGEISLVVAVASPHRREAFEACRHLVDRLKSEVPIWKKEVWRDGGAWVDIERPWQPGTTVD